MISGILLMTLREYVSHNLHNLIPNIPAATAGYLGGSLVSPFFYTAIKDTKKNNNQLLICSRSVKFAASCEMLST